MTGFSQYEMRIRQLVESSDAKLAGSTIIPFFKGPQLGLILGIANTTPRALLAVQEGDARLLSCNIFGSKIEEIIWQGSPTKLSYAKGIFYWELVVEDKKLALFIGRGRDRREFLHVLENGEKQ